MAALRPDGTMAPAQGRKPLVPITETPSQGGPANLAAETPSASDVQDHFSQEMPDRLSKYYERSPSLAPSYFKRGGVQTGLGEVNGGVSGDPEYYRSLGKAAQAALIHLIMKYHETLLQKGLTAEAEKISSSLKALRDDPIGDANKELTGMDLLMKDGLLQYMLKIGPLLPTLPAQVVTFKNLSYSSKVTFTKGTYETVGTQVIGLGTQFVTKKTTGDVDILKNVTGYVMPGTMTLVLGGPGSGKSTLQSLLSGMPHKDKTTTIKGEVRYNGKHVIGGPSESAGFAVRKLAALVKQSDVHFAALSVRETLEFARSCTQVWTFEEMFRRSPELREVFGAVLAQGKDPKLENVINILGLRRVLNMPVGGPMTPPTLTEDERRRVSAAEMVAGTYVLLFLDAFATGVDAATAYDIASGLRVLARVRQLGIVANIVNPPPEVFGLFDRVILLDRGRVVYQGPRADAVPHFESLGYIKPDFLDITEFLQEVTSPDGAQWLSPGHSPLDLGGFVSAYEATPHYADILRVVNSADPPHVLSVKAPKPLGLNLLARNGVPAIARIEASSSLTSAEQTVHFTGAVKEGDVITAVSAPEGGLVYLAGKGGEASVEELEARLHEAADPVRLQLERATPEPDDKDIINEQFTQEYSLPFWAEYRFLFDRAWKAQLRGKLLLYFRAFQITFISLFVGTIFWQLNESADFAHMNTRRGVGFLSLMSTFLCNAIQLPGQLADRAVFYKQQGARFYRPGSYLLASVAANFPFSCLEALTYGVIVYFMTGLSLHEGSGHFWLFLLVIFLNVQQGALLVRWLSSFAPAMETAAALQGEA
ncbi:pleiotropic drug resistance protein [Klebsormidium nitens]|uniref:Pleiotropic drug resistance protein n=1 Tax=Klebsormidium nitens TaxID=105231 RepID=A0A1Y1I3Z5_KLENI|nr:pleiotropic drug resistance protein [Klebsormidium nitens]|eukprot:GAQ83467.1 pleiotropic drug resistance protein [Klebsormidium nitens]